MKALKLVFLLSVLFIFSASAAEFSSFLSIEDAAKRGLVKLTIKSKGGYTGDVMELKVQNLTNKNLALKIEAGRRLDSKKENEQDILVTREQEFMAAAQQTKVINVLGMCCQAHNAAPSEKAFYSVGKLADSLLIKLAKFIDTNEFHNEYAAQQAVWVISDDNSIGSISDGKKETRDKIREFVSKLTGKAIPNYDINYRSGLDGSAMGRATHITAAMNYSLPMNCHATMIIVNERGEVVQTIFEDQTAERGDYKIYYTFRTKDLAQGTYYVRVNADGMLQKQEKIEF